MTTRPIYRNIFSLLSKVTNSTSCFHKKSLSLTTSRKQKHSISCPAWEPWGQGCPIPVEPTVWKAIPKKLSSTASTHQILKTRAHSACLEVWFQRESRKTTNKFKGMMTSNEKLKTPLLGKTRKSPQSCTLGHTQNISHLLRERKRDCPQVLKCCDSEGSKPTYALLSGTPNPSGPHGRECRTLCIPPPPKTGNQGVALTEFGVDPGKLRQGSLDFHL